MANWEIWYGGVTADIRLIYGKVWIKIWGPCQCPDSQVGPLGNSCSYYIAVTTQYPLICTSPTGFRNNSRKIVIYMTDQGSHIAGDGRLGGIFTPNDGNCHTGSELPGHYTKSLDMDYPSIEQVSEAMGLTHPQTQPHRHTHTHTQPCKVMLPWKHQVNRKLIESDIIPIFAVGERVQGLYEELSNHLTQLSDVGRWFIIYLIFY